MSDLTRDVLKDFADIVIDESNKDEEVTAYGTTVESDGVDYVKLDGSSLLTPITTTTDIKPGERVLVLIKNHQAVIIGNSSNPSAGSQELNNLKETVNLDKATIKDLVANNVTINDSLKANSARIDSLEATNVEINGKLTADRADITRLDTEKLNADEADIRYAKVDELRATSADVVKLNADYAKFKDASVKRLDANEASIKDLDAKKLSAEAADIKYLTIDNAKATYLQAGDFTAYKATVENLLAAKANIKDLEAEYLKASQIEANYAKISALDAVTANIKTLNTDLANVEKLVANKAEISDLNAANAKIETLNTDLANVTKLVASKVDADYVQAEIVKANQTITDDLKALHAVVDTLDTKYATIEQLNAAKANLEELVAKKANISELNAAKATIGELNGLVANINSILSGSIGTGTLQTIHLTAENVVIDDAIIKSANIEGLDVSKLNAGTISTNKFAIKSDDGGIVISGSTQQFKDKNNKVRLQIGKDAQGNFNFIVFGEDGSTAIYNQNGITKQAVPDGLIVDQMVSDTANIQAKKIQYIDKDGNKTLQTVIEQEQGKISELIKETTIDGSSLKDKYLETVKTVDGMKTTIGDVQSNQTSMSSKITEIEISTGGIKTNVTKAQTTADSAKTTAEQTASKFSWLVKSGTSATDFTLTDRTAQLVANNINLNGLVTFSGLNKDTQNKITETSNKVDSIKQANNLNNLIINGYGELGDNTNFSDCDYMGNSGQYDDIITFSKSGYGNTVWLGDALIPVNTLNEYTFSMNIKPNKDQTIYYVGFAEYDIDKRLINAAYQLTANYTYTTLERDLKDGDTIVYLKDASSFIVPNNAPRYRLGLIFWNYKDSKGHLYEPGVYSRNSWGNLYNYTDVDKSTNTIKLKAAWNHGTIKAGTKVSQSNDGGYKYFILSYTELNADKWTHVKWKIKGQAGQFSQYRAEKFNNATKYIKFVLLSNYQGTERRITYLNSICLRDTTLSSIVNNKANQSIIDNWAKDSVVNGETVINGGYIKTNTIKTDQLAVDDIFATGSAAMNIINAQEINANRITSGLLSAERINAYGLSILNKATNQQTFNISNNGEVTIRGSVSSSNYNIGKTGWAINNDGTAEFNDIVARGSVITNDGGIVSSGGTGVNLQKDTSFYNQLNDWSEGSNWSVDNTFIYETTKTAKFSRTGLTSDSVQYLYSGNNDIKCNAGQTFTAQCNFYTKDKSKIDGSGVSLGILFYDKSGGAINSSKSVVTFVDDKWVYKEITATAPTNSTYVAIVISANRNGEFWIAQPKIEEGPIATPWSPAPEDKLKQVRFWAGGSYDERESAPWIVYSDGSMKATQGEFSGVFSGTVDIGNIKIADPSSTAGGDALLTIQNGQNGIKRVQLTDSSASRFAQDIIIADDHNADKISLKQDGTAVIHTGINVGNNVILNGKSLFMNNNELTTTDDDVSYLFKSHVTLGTSVSPANLIVNGNANMNDITVNEHLYFGSNVKITKVSNGVNIDVIK